MREHIDDFDVGELGVSFVGEREHKAHVIVEANLRASVGPTSWWRIDERMQVAGTQKGVDGLDNRALIGGKGQERVGSVGG